MQLERRHSRILDALAKDGVASVRGLATMLLVSESTIRRDLQLLDQNGELIRTHGGALLRRSSDSPIETADLIESPWDVELTRNFPLKAAMARAAAELVQDGQVIILDIGTTTPLIARALRGRPVTIITGNLGVLDELRGDDTVRLVLLGGIVRRNYQSLVGSLAQSALESVTADLLFLSCTGVRNNGFVVDDMAVEAPIKQKLIEVSDLVALLVPATKFPGTGSLRLCSVTDLDVLITTEGANADVLSRCREAGGKVIVA